MPANAAAAHAVGRQSFLVVFDFDHTLVDCNSDEVVPTALGRAELLRQLTTQRMQWTRLVDTLLAPYTREEVVRAVRASVRVDADMPAVLRYLRSLQKQYNYSELRQQEQQQEQVHNDSSNGNTGVAAAADVVPGMLEVGIASDANAWFIDATLDACFDADTRALFTQIHTNPCYDVMSSSSNGGSCDSRAPCGVTACADDEATRDAVYNAHAVRRSRVAWYEPQGHTCVFCNAHAKPNMCKSRLLHRMLATTNLIDPTIVYVGDGVNDYCPVLNVLRPRDVVLARRDMRLHGMLAGTLQKQQQQQQQHSNTATELVGGCCAVGLWRNAAELLQLLRSILEPTATATATTTTASAASLPYMPRLPTLVRFRDVSGGEFRAVTLQRRMPAVLQRTLAENDAARADKNNDSCSTGTTAAAAATAATSRSRVAQRMHALIDSCEHNTCVPTLPGQRALPAWLRSYAYASEYDRVDADDVPRRATVVDAAHTYRAVAARWGQLPWLHGEIYFYHLLWQYMMLADDTAHAQQTTQQQHGSEAAHGDDEAARTCADAQCLVNVVTPYVVAHPLHVQTCDLTLAAAAATTTAAAATTTTAQHTEKSSVCDGGVLHQRFAADFLAREPLACAAGITVQLRDDAPSPPSLPTTHGSNDGNTTPPMRCVTYADLADAPGDGLVRPHTFAPYRDIFAREKHHLLHGFVQTRVLPMLACEPWCADVTFLPVLLRWMLWANALDLSMFTLDQLSATHGSSSSSNDNATKDGCDDDANDKDNNNSGGGGDKGSSAHAAQQRLLRSLRAHEAARTLQQDDFLVGNHVDAVVAYVTQLVARVRAAATCATAADVPPCGIDIVMDNVGVECIADLCFGLWYLHHAGSSDAHNNNNSSSSHNNSSNSSSSSSAATARARVTFHVKPMPYYVSDVTPVDLTTLLDSLEALYSANDTSSASADAQQQPQQQRDMLARVLQPFVQRVRAAFASGAFCLDADLAWTQPCEYRELPPRVVNRFFYTQRVVPPRDAAAAAAAAAVTEDARATHDTTSATDTTAAAAAQFWRANKQVIVPRSALVVYKGDLNYRRLIGDRHWNYSDFVTTLTTASNSSNSNNSNNSNNNSSGEKSSSCYCPADDTDATRAAALCEVLHDTPADAGLDGASFAEVVSAYWPTHVVPVCSIRTIKSECCVGVPGSAKARLDATVGVQWRISGKYGEVLFASS